MSDIRRILFIELLGGIGDSVIALPTIHALARSHPQAQVTVLTFAPGSELLTSDPLIHRVVVAEKGKARLSVETLLRQETFDLIVSDTSYDGIDEIIQNAPAGRVITNLWRSPPPNQFVGDRFLQLLLEDGVITGDAVQSTAPQIHLTIAEKTAARATLRDAFRPLVVLVPEAGMAIKRWSTANFVTLGQALQQRYGATLVVLAGAEPELAAQIARSIGGTAQLTKGSLRQVAALLAAADLTIAADTGIARISAALKIPTVTLFGPSWHGRYGQSAPHVNLQGFAECPERKIANFTQQPCWYSGTCPYDWNTCLDDLSPATVLEAAARLLEAKNPIAEPGDGRSIDGDGRSVDTEGRSMATEQQVTVIDRRSIREDQRSIDADRRSINTAAGEQRFVPMPLWRSVRNLLVMRLDNIGDVMMTTPALRALRENLPDARITLMASPGGALTEPLLPWVDAVLPERVLWQDLGRLEFDPAREWALIERLKAQQFDAAIVLTSFSQSPHPAGLICQLAGIPLRLGESKEDDRQTLTHAVPPASDEIHQVDRNLRLLEFVGFTVSDRRLSLAVPPDARQTMRQRLKDLPYLLLNPWTSCQSRNYAPDRFAAAARQLSEATGWRVVVTGVAKDRDRAQPLLDVLGDRAIDLIGATSLSELVAIVADAKLLLTNNTSTMHVADAVGTPSVILFAGTELECQWQPRHSLFKLLRRPTVCSPCYAFQCPYDLSCLDISVETVVDAGLNLLKMSGAFLQSIDFAGAIS